MEERDVTTTKQNISLITSDTDIPKQLIFLSTLVHSVYFNGLFLINFGSFCIF